MILKSFRDYLMEAESTDIEASGTYACLVPTIETKNKLHSWLKEKNIENLLEEKDYHCTVVYSTKAVPEVANIPTKFPIVAKPKEWKIFGTDNLLVLAIDSEPIVKLFDETIALGAKTDYPSFIPHISVAKNYTDQIPSDLPQIDIIFNKFKTSSLDEDFEYDSEDD